MATEFTLHIDIQNLPSSTSKAKEKLDQLSGKSSGNNIPNNSDKNSLLKTAKGIGAVALGRQVLNTGISYGRFRASTISARYGDTARQNELNNMMTIMDNGLSFVKSGVSGAISGAAVGGPVGAAVGAVLGVVSDAIGNILQSVERYEMWSMKQDKNKFEEIRSSERLGLMKSDRNRGK